MLVHADQAGDGGTAGAVDGADPRRERDTAVRAESGDAAVIDQDRLIGARWSAGAVDDGDVDDRGQRPALADRIRRRRRLGTAGERGEQGGE